jgi:hypothetical protein
MPVAIAIVCEDRPDYTLATELADRVLCELVTWIDAEVLDHYRHYVNFEPTKPYITWAELRRKFDRSVRVRGFVNQEVPDYDAQQARRALVLIESRYKHVEFILLIRDSDRLKARLNGLEQARTESKNKDRIIIGLAHTMRECWVMAGFEPLDEAEQQLLDEARQDLGFDPREKAELLTARHEHDKKSPKRVLAHLTRGNREREAMCWSKTALSLLRRRGQKTGLRSFLEEVENRLVAAFAPATGVRTRFAPGGPGASPP